MEKKVKCYTEWKCKCYGIKMDIPSGSNIYWIGMEMERNWNKEIGEHNDINKWLWILKVSKQFFRQQH